jgi:hypothetical protein
MRSYIVRGSKAAGLVIVAEVIDREEARELSDRTDESIVTELELRNLPGGPSALADWRSGERSAWDALVADEGAEAAAFDREQQELWARLAAGPRRELVAYATSELAVHPDHVDEWVANFYASRGIQPGADLRPV